ncbi:hypothetical protein LTR08_001370 [Meristemomyces frigidus]|nr:hypothetical protein LTR08_001370 [Meristemomyces frigidus]
MSGGDATTAVAAGSTAATSSTSTATSAQSTSIVAGPYTCTSSITFDFFADILADHLESTETDLQATITYLIMNIHAAALASDPTASARAPSDNALPRDSTLLSTILAGSNSAYMYTPTRLQSDRADLNSSRSWFNVPATSRPDTAYFSIMEQAGRDVTLNGWPSESFVELQKGFRMMAGYGTIDPQMQAYNVSGDALSIFPQGYLQTLRAVTTSEADGSVEGGCFYNSQVLDLASANSSWAVASPANVASQAANLTSCGISPLLNQTLQNVTAAENYRPYQTFALSTIWPWTPGQPRSTSSTDKDDDDQQDRCAVLNATAGRWQTTDCMQSHYGACRVLHQPYQWHISDAKGEYMKVSEACNSKTLFAAPRTALENTYLVASWRQHLQTRSSSSRSFATRDDDDADELLFIDFNSLDAETCWVVGQNTTCPYLPQRSDQERQVVVPTVAAVVVFVLAALTVFVKCAANRQNSRRKRRRRDEGWDYEGVPS